MRLIYPLTGHKAHVAHVYGTKSDHRLAGWSEWKQDVREPGSMNTTNETTITIFVQDPEVSFEDFKHFADPYSVRIVILCSLCPPALSITRFSIPTIPLRAVLR